MSEQDPFTLHPRLDADCRVIGDLPVCRLLLMNDRRFPWCILVPRRAGLDGLHELPARWRGPLLEEVARVSSAILERCAAQRINVGALGNLVPQLHVHVVGRRAGDAAWPGPVWGHGSAEPYAPEAAAALCAHLWEHLSAATGRGPA